MESFCSDARNGSNPDKMDHSFAERTAEQSQNGALKGSDMASMQPQVDVYDLGVARPDSCRVLVAQQSCDLDSWDHHDGLWFARDHDPIRQWLAEMLDQAEASTADIVVLPELSVPEDCIAPVQSWSARTGAIVVAGSHYYADKRGYVSRCPVVIGGKVHFVEKLVPSPLEVSPVAGQGLQPGKSLAVFKNTAAGDFAVAICSDYLDNDCKAALLERSLDLLCVPAFQSDSAKYHARMNIDCEEETRGIYLLYSNTRCKGYADGRSAIFAVMDRMYLDGLRNGGFTDLNPSTKICELATNQGYAIVQLSLRERRPLLGRTVHSRPNVTLLKVGGSESRAEAFASRIGHRDDRYYRIQELFVPPSEYDRIVQRLNARRLLFLIGDPGIGKTYIAVSLLRNYFDRGYEPMWFSGLEQGERLRQRDLLENYRPRVKEAIYFEDPFGRTVFERRESVARSFGRLLDSLSDVDARVIVTSRREIFEQFLEEVPSFEELRQLAEDLNVVKPSYSIQALLTILDRNGEQALWYADARCRSFVIEQIEQGRIRTPLAIRDFVLSTHELSSYDKLSERLAHRSFEERASLAQEIQSCDPETKIALSLVLLAGAHPLATLAQWFNELGRDISPSRVWSGTAPFLSEIRRQLSFRVEQFGVRYPILRFSHPTYEEALVDSARVDASTTAALEAVARVIACYMPPAAVDAVLRLTTKYCDVGLSLFAAIAPVLRRDATRSDRIRAGLRLLREFRRSDNRQYLDEIQRVLSVFEAAALINEEVDVDSVAQALRFCVQYGESGGSEHGFDWRIEVSKLIDWRGLEDKWRAEARSSRILSQLEWAHRIEGRRVRRFLESLPGTELIARFRSLTPPDRMRLLRLTQGWKMHVSLAAEFGSESLLPRSRRIQTWMLDTSDTRSGVVIDRGAVEAIQRGYNLLPVGIVGTLGDFDRQDVIHVLDESGVTVAAGVSAYSKTEVERIRGRHSRLISSLLGYDYGVAVLPTRSLLLQTGVA